jgi:hypothetical protein
VRHTQINAIDATKLSQQLGEWNFEFAQLKGGSFKADGIVLQLDGVSIARISMTQTLLQRGYAPRGMVAVFMPGVGSGPAFAQGQLVGSGQCVTLAGGEQLEAITHGPYLDVDFAFDMVACRAQLDPVMSDYTDDARRAPPDSVARHDSCRPDILGSNVLAASTSLPAVDDVRWVGQPPSVGCD